MWRGKSFCFSEKHYKSKKGTVTNLKSVDLKRPSNVLNITIAAALAAGMVNGVLGTGGGIVLAYLFAYLKVGDEKDVLACSMAVILPVSLVSLLTYKSGYFENFTHFLATAVPAGIGGLLGAYLSDKSSPIFLRRLFAVIVIYAGANMIL